ncbi:tudor domain-containing protein 6-like [Lethenteron reissneri]|uniref:tudor domain-containing protein 6-like n=1 Tax=Lethenteron reissneri TaxID=7753 RepID=UPI002AB65D2E|nr:tudor domain-containing protein 6-like [Lethenteron reissneri]
MSRYPCPLKCGYKLDVLLSHAEPQSPDNPLLLRFWARLTRADIDANFSTIRKAVMMPPSWEPVGLSTPLAVGEPCIAWYSKEASWHRAKVLAHAESQQSQQGIVHNYLVFFIDLGLREVVQAGFMREGRPEFFQIPPMMQCYALANVLPMSNCWSKMVLDYVESQRDTKMHGCVEGFLDDHTIVVNLELMVTQLCQMRCARRVDSNVFQLIVKIMDDAKPETAQLPKLPTVSPANLGNLKHHFNAEPPPIIPPAGPKIRSAEGRHEMSAFYSTRMPVGTLQAVLVTHVISPDSFFCQLQSFRLDLQRLIQLMALHYLEADARGVQFPLPPNSPCAVLNTRIGQWYRGLVIHNSSPSEALVHFVDFGNRACMPSKHLQPLLSEFFDLPVQAFRCAMVGAHATLQEGSRIWSTEEVLLLKSILLNSVFTAQVVSYNRIEKLYYVVLLDQNGQSAFQKFSEMAATRPAMEATLPDRVATVATLPDTAATAIGHGSGVPPSVMAPPPMALAGVGAGRPVFTALKLHLQNFTHVYAENIVSPDEFWVRLTSKNEEFEKLMVQMQKHFSLAGPHEGLLDKSAVGMACCAMCPNNMFYRATVTDVISARKVQVQCVDYGISQFVEPKDIRALPPHFLELPACVVRCRLAGVAPPEVRHQGGDRTSTDRWSPMATWFFNSQVFNKHVAMIPRSKSADGYEVDLYSIGKSESSSIAKELIRSGLAVALSSHAELLKVNSAGVSDSMVAASSPAGPSSDGANDHDSVVPQPQEVAPVPRPAVGGSITVVEPLMFVVGEMADVIVTSIKSPWEFWCRLKSAERDVALLNRKMNEHYRNWKAPLPHLEAGVCVAHYAPEDQWYRVFIYEVVKGSRSMASVLILDDGREVQVSTRDLYPIDPQFLKLKMQAFKCSLYNCLEAHEEQRDQATEMFKSFTKKALACGLNCTIIMLVERNKRDFFNLVDLHTPFQSVSAQLVSRGLAKLLDPPGHLAESDCPLSFPYSTHGIKIGAEEGVIMTHAEGPSRFWCQLTRNDDALKLFMVKLGKHCSHAYSRQTFDMKRRLCFAQYAGDGQWHRALATQGPNPNEVNVSFIDYGNNEVVEKSKLLPLLPDAYDLAELPCQAIQCFLVDVSAPKEGFPDSVLSFFRAMVYSSDMKAVVLCREDFGQLGLELFHGTQRLNTTINQMLNPPLPPSRGLHQLPEVIAQTGSAHRDAVTYRAREQSHRPPVTSAPSHEPPERLVPVLGPAPAQGRHKPADREPEQSAVYLRKGNSKHAELPSSKREQPEALPRRVFGSDSLRMDQVVRERSPDAMNTAGYGKAMHEEPSYSFWRQIRESENSSRQWRDKATTRDRNGRSVHSEGSSQADGTCSLTRDNVTPHNAAAHNVTPDNVTPKYLESSVTSVLGDTTLEERTLSCSPICHSTVIDEEGYATREKEQEAKAKIIPKLEDLAASPVGDGQAGATLNVFVLHVVTPSRFYVQLASDEQTIYGLAEELNDGSVSGGSLRPSDLKLGDLICAKYSDDESWYRAVVRGFEPDDPLALVEFIDYGNTDRVGSDSMSELRTEFLRHPRRSIACSLAGVRPCVSIHGNKWTKEATELFTETVHDLELRCEVSVVNPRRNGKSSNRSSSRSGTSRPWKQLPNRTVRRLTPHMRTIMGWRWTASWRLGQQYEVYVSLARGLDNFWCQLKVLADEQLTSLMSVIETTGDEREVSLAMVEVGGLYLARYSEDNVLYRARVLDVAAGRAKVMFIDYGNEEELDVSCLRGVPPNVAVAPPFAFPCFLRGSTGCIVPDEVTNAFVDACLEESRMLKVVAVVTTVADCCTHSAFYEVELYDEHGDPFSEKYLRGTFAQDPLQRQEQGPVVDLDHAESGQGETKEAPPKDEVSDKEKVPLFEKARLKSSAEEVHADVEPYDGGNPEPVISTIKDYPAAPPLAAGETLSVHCLSYNLELGEVSSPAAGTGEELLGEEEEVIPPLRLEELVPGTPCTFRSRVEAVVLEGEYDATVAVVRHEDSDAEEEVHVPLVLRLGKDPIALPPHDSCCCSFDLAGTSEGCQGGGKGHCQGTDVQWVVATAACEDGGSGQWIGGGEPVVETGGRPPAAVEPGRVDPPLDQLAQETQDPSHETEELDDCAVVADEEVVGGEECEYEEVEMTAASDDNNQNSAWTGGEGGEPHLLVPCKGREEELPRHLVLASVGEQDCATADGASVDIAGHAEASMLPHDSAVVLLPASGSLALGDSERRMGRDVGTERIRQVCRHVRPGLGRQPRGVRHADCTTALPERRCSRTAAEGLALPIARVSQGASRRRV